MRTSLANEAQTQQAIIEALEWKKYIVLTTSRQKRTCIHCGKRDHRGDGVDKGLPDLVVTRRGWPAGAWIGLEVKGPRTPVSSEQRNLADQGRIVIVRSAHEAFRAMENAEAAFGGRR